MLRLHIIVMYHIRRKKQTFNIMLILLKKPNQTQQKPININHETVFKPVL